MRWKLLFRNIRKIVIIQLDILKKQRQTSDPIPTRFYIETFLIYAAVSIAIDTFTGTLFAGQVEKEIVSVRPFLAKISV